MKERLWITANKTDFENLDQQVKSMMKHSDNANPFGKGKARVCRVCGKEGSKTYIKNPILVGSLFPVVFVEDCFH